MPVIAVATRLSVSFAVRAVVEAACDRECAPAIAKVCFLRICTDNEINVVVKPEQVCLRGDRYINLEGML